MKKEITVGQLLGVGVSLLIAVVTGWVTLNNKVSTSAAEIKALEVRVDKIERMEAKIDKIYDVVNNLSIKVENKKDRDK